jgi:hypothetical protein
MAGRKVEVFHNHLVLAYILLVGLPLLGLFSVLEAGRGVVPLPAVSGEWSLDLDASPAVSGNCLAPLTGAQRPVLAISQSGANVVASFNQAPKVTLTCTLEGNHLAGVAETGASGCGEGALMRLAATVGGKPGQHSLDGHLSWEGCALCTPVAFHGVRQTSSRKPGQ